MNYVTGSTIRKLREEKKLTQSQLAQMVNVTDKAVSKWETDRGLPDMGIIGELSKALGVSVAELLSGDIHSNTNRKANLSETKFFVCPVCGNVICSVGNASVSCCGILLPALEADEPACSEQFSVEISDGEFYVCAESPMTKTDFISFIACVTDDSVQIKKLYPEQIAEARFRIGGQSTFYAFSTRSGLLSFHM